MFKGINHIGIAVRDLEMSAKLFADIFNIEQPHRETVEEQKVSIASFKVGNVLIELTAPTDDSSPIAKFIQKNGEGIHHIAFETDDITNELERLMNQGINLINQEPGDGAHNMLIAFLHPKSTNSVLIEICQNKKSKENMSQLILLRHGESQWNLENRFTGWTDIDLSPKGVQEAIFAGLLLKPYKIDYVFTSALKRAQHTTEIVLEQSGKNHLPVAKDKALNERHYGDLQGLKKDDIKKEFGKKQLKIWRRSYDVPPPNGESLKDTQERVYPYYKEHIEPLLKKGKNVLISAHGNSLRAIVMFIEKLTPKEIVEIDIPTAVPYVYDLDADLNVIKKTILDPTKVQNNTGR